MPAVVLGAPAAVIGTVADGAAIGSDEPVVIAGSDGTNVRRIWVTTAGAIRIDPTGTTTQPVSVSSLPLPTGAATEVTLGTRATEATLALVKAKTDNIDVLLSTRATETTLSTRLAEATFTARINTLGQKAMAASTPVTFASDQSALAVTVASLPLPTGAATAALQTQPGVDIGDVTVNNAAGASAVNIQDGGNSITIDATSLPLPTGAATAANQTAASLVDNAAFTDGTTRVTPSGHIFDETAGTALTENDVGASRMDSKRAQIIAIEDATNRGRRLAITAANAATVDGSAVTQPVSASSLPLPAGAATAALQTQPGVDIGDVTINNAAGASAVNIQDGGNSITVDGTVGISGTVPVSGPLTDVQLRATAVPVSAASLPLPTGAATAALQTQPGVDIGDVTVNNGAAGAAVNIQDGGNSITVDASSWPLPTGAATEATVATLLLNSTFNSRINTLGQKVMASSTPVVISSDQSTLPISAASLPLPAGAATAALQTQPGVDIGDVTVNNAAGAGAVNIQDGGNSITVDATSLPLPTGAATAALQTQPGVDIGDVTVNNAAGASAVNIQDGGNSITVDATSWPLPTGAATETTLASRLADATFTARVNTLGQKAMAASTPIVIASDQTVIPVSDNGGSLTVDGTVTANQGTAAALSGGWPVKVTDGTNVMPTGDAIERSVFQQISDGTTGPVKVTPASTAAGAADKALVVTVSPFSAPITITNTPAGARTGVSYALKILGGGTAGTLQVMRATVYTEPTSAAQRSISSSSASDTSAGVGARTVKITYYNNTGVGPFTEIVTLNGTTAVNTVATDIRFIENIEVVTAGSTLSNVGTISLFGTTGGGGGTVGSIGVGTVISGVGDNRTLWAHHYIAVGYTAQMSVLVIGIQSGGSATNGQFFVRSSQPLVANSAEVIVGDSVLSIGTFERVFTFNPNIVGFARLTAYAVPGVNNATISCAFDWSEVVS